MGEQEYQGQTRKQIIKAPSPEMIPSDAPSMADWVSANKPLKIGIAVALVVLIVISEFVLRPHFQNPETWTATMETIDAKKANVLALTGSTVGLSAGISAIPGDAGTPIADTLMDLSKDLGIVLGVLYLEKYMLTIFSFAAFGIVLPLACLAFLAALLAHGNFSTSALFSKFGARLLAISLVLIFVVPASVWITEMVDDTFETAITTNTETSTTEEGGTTEKDEGLLGFIEGVAESVSNGVSSLSQSVLDNVNKAIEGVAVMIVTSCVIPVLVLLLFLYLAHMLLGVDISVPMNVLSNRVPVQTAKVKTLPKE